MLATLRSSIRTPSPRFARPFSSSVFASSHVGSNPIPLPPSVSFEAPPTPTNVSTHSASNPLSARVRGPKGELLVPIHPFVRLSSTTPAVSSASAAPSASTLTVSVDDAKVKHQRAIWGLTRALLANAVKGVSEGYTLPLRLVGVGYRAAVEDVPNAASGGPRQRLNLKLGYSHPVLIDLPLDISATTPAPTSILLTGIDKQRVGQLAAKIRKWRVPEPYNGKGIFVGDEQVRRKEVKKK
ncbi:60S ribosomal protein [Rhodotorula toruloides]|uniref:60S ribosomal protein n=1 Tax=Rhodotorula toruloides TaxID=5286 RepID=A0A511KM43_RHOTO|nr:60S ribosomal protein [Rhodotorula toruloides]